MVGVSHFQRRVTINIRNPMELSPLLEAIFNPNLPAKERKDFMEDWNEQGLSDPKRPRRPCSTRF
jgi:hypothetical protein